VRLGREHEGPGAPLSLLITLACLQVAVLALLPAGTAGHSMGEAVPVAYIEGQDKGFAANVVAAYFGEQMGREIRLIPGESGQECLEMLRSGMAPMAVLDQIPGSGSLKGISVAGQVPVAGRASAVLVMGEDAGKQLQFSLVPMYMEKLKSVLAAEDWEKGLARIRRGEGVRKVALDMLRGKDLI